MLQEVGRRSRRQRRTGHHFRDAGGATPQNPSEKTENEYPFPNSHFEEAVSIRRRIESPPRPSVTHFGADTTKRQYRIKMPQKKMTSKKVCGTRDSAGERVHHRDG